MYKRQEYTFNDSKQDSLLEDQQVLVDGQFQIPLHEIGDETMEMIVTYNTTTNKSLDPASIPLAEEDIIDTSTGIKGKSVSFHVPSPLEKEINKTEYSKLEKNSDDKAAELNLDQKFIDLSETTDLSEYDNSSAFLNSKIKEENTPSDNSFIKKFKIAQLSSDESTESSIANETDTEHPYGVSQIEKRFSKQISSIHSDLNQLANKSSIQAIQALSEQSKKDNTTISASDSFGTDISAPIQDLQINEELSISVEQNNVVSASSNNEAVADIILSGMPNLPKLPSSRTMSSIINPTSDLSLESVGSEKDKSISNDVLESIVDNSNSRGESITENLKDPQPSKKNKKAQQVSRKLSRTKNSKNTIPASPLPVLPSIDLSNPFEDYLNTTEESTFLANPETPSTYLSIWHSQAGTKPINFLDSTSPVLSINSQFTNLSKASAFSTCLLYTSRCV